MATKFSVWDSATLQVKLALVGAVIALTLVHMRHPRAHALSAVILVGTVAIVWLGLDLTR